MSNLTPRRRNLVIVRAGANSLHPTWLLNAESRDWDLVVSVYDDSDFVHGDDVVITHRRGGKWDGIGQYFDETGALDSYDYVWMPDDDIATNCDSISLIFSEMRRLDLDISQPSLSWDSFYTHFITLSCPGLRLRYTNFIEIMIPCANTRIMKLVLPDIRNSMSGFGMDPIWSRLSDEPAFKAAILDSVRMRHTRPVGGSLHTMMGRMDRSATTEAKRIQQLYDVERKIRPLVYAMIDDTDGLVTGKTRLDRFYLGINMCMRYAKVYRACSFQEPAVWKLLQLIRRQTSEPLELWQLQRAITS
jgi:hypothetical protein